MKFPPIFYVMILGLSLFALPAFAALHFGVTVEPIVGYELNQKLLPTPHTSNRLVYGARATAGISLIAAEAEYTHGTDTETFPDIGLTTADTAEKLKLGLRTELSLTSMILFRLRGGVQANQTRHDETTGGVLNSTLQPIVYKPYAGTGLGIRVTPKITASADIVVVFTDLSNLSNNELQTTAGFSIRFP